jgi:hypothetical protein
MKIYLFNSENGVYLGEDFSDEPFRAPDSGGLPEDATAIVPPEVGPGRLLVFNVKEQRWTTPTLQQFKSGPSQSSASAVSVRGLVSDGFIQSTGE